MPIFTPQQLAIQLQNLPSEQVAQSGELPTGLNGYVPNSEGNLPWPYKAGLVGANLFDGISTRKALSSNNNAREANPLLAPLANSTPGFLAAKAGFGLLQASILNNVAKEHPKLARGLSLISMALPTIAGVSNLSKIK